jgi:hypothetical protein
MKINEIIIEGKIGRIPKRAAHAAKGEWLWRDDGIDRVYNLNRVMMAAAQADGKTVKALDCPEQSWYGKMNVARPYTEEEHKMMRSAFKTIDSEVEHSIPDHRSLELDSVNKSSPTATPKKNKYGV